MLVADIGSLCLANSEEQIHQFTRALDERGAVSCVYVSSQSPRKARATIDRFGLIEPDVLLADMGKTVETEREADDIAAVADRSATPMPLQTAFDVLDTLDTPREWIVVAGVIAGLGRFAPGVRYILPGHAARGMKARAVQHPNTFVASEPGLLGLCRGLAAYGVLEDRVVERLAA